MTKSSFRALLATGVAALLAVATLPAAAATLTYSDPNCASFQITGGGGSFTLSCAKLTCTIAATPAAPTTAQDTSLQATCTSNGVAPTGTVNYLWSLVTGAFSDVTCNAPSPLTTTSLTAGPAVLKPNGIVAGNTRTCLYQVNATATGAGLTGQAMLSVTWNDAPPSPPTCAALSATTSPNPMTNAGGTVQVNSSCSAPGLTIYYTWTRTAAPTGADPFAASGAASQSDTLKPNATPTVATYTYQLQACTTANAAPGTCASTQSISVQVPGVGGGGGGVDCSPQGFTKTILVDVPWTTASPMQWQTLRDFGGMNPTTALVIRLGAAPLGTNLTNYGHVTAAEFGDNTMTRTAVLSTQACDWSNTIGSPWYVQEQTTVDWALRAFTSGAPYGYHDLIMQPGQTYYINIKNYNLAGANTCTPYGSSCNMVVNWIKPY